ncbi:MAG: prepilin-type N-terminal cleavage/methylation domain-containing protein [bacterium]|jgi:type II secretion system protein G|nr:prepilin-type N-terminal cleavage/methylation domain-containing protein [bacterium]
MKRDAGFTLIELLIVVAIIGILAAIAVPNFMNAQIRAKIARVQADIKAQGTALEQYRLDNNNYPPSNVAAPRLWRLTTPIAYMSNCPPDVFGDPLMAYMGYYHYVERKSEEAWFRADWHSAQGDLHTTANIGLEIPGGLYWHIRSVGPDKELDYGFPYAASNGLVSNGDIDIFGP